MQPDPELDITDEQCTRLKEGIYALVKSVTGSERAQFAFMLDRGKRGRGVSYLHCSLGTAKNFVRWLMETMGQMSGGVAPIEVSGASGLALITALLAAAAGAGRPAGEPAAPGGPRPTNPGSGSLN